MDNLLTDGIQSLGYLQEPATPTTATESIQEKRPLRDGSKYGKDSVEKTKLYSPKARFWIITITVATYIIAIMAVVAHHIFAGWLNNRVIPYDFADSQRWILRSNNFISKFVATCLRFPVGIAIVQAAWNAISSDYTSVIAIDDLFSLPSPLSLLSVLWRVPSRQMLPVIGLACFFQSLVLVSLLAPSALTISSQVEVENVPIPILNLSTAPINTDPGWWRSRSDHYINNDITELWDVPKECGSGCSFSLTYQAPGVSCRDLSDDEISLMPYDEQSFAGGQNWTFYESNVSDYEFMWGSDSIGFDFSYIQMNASPTGTTFDVWQSPPQGRLCNFHDKTYEAQFDYYGRYKSVSWKTLSNSSTLEQACSWATPEALSPNCKGYAMNAGNISYAFASIFNGYGELAIGELGAEPDVTWTQYPLISILPYFWVKDDGIVSFLVDDAVGQTIEDTFSTVVLGFLLHFNQIETENVLVEGPNIWYFQPLRLWVVYGPFLLLALVLGLYGIHLARGGDVVRENKFSSLFISTRTKELDAIRTLSPQRIMSTKVKHDKTNGGLALVDNSSDDTVSDKVALEEPATRDWTRMKIVLPFILGIALAIGHHFFLSYIDGTPEDLFPQFVANRISMGFAIIVSLCLSISAVVSLIQASWRALKLQGGSIGTIDNFFALPSPKAIALLVTKRPTVQATYLIIIGIVVNALGLLSSLAPGAATVVKYHYPTTLAAPASNLSSPYFADSEEETSYDDLWHAYVVDYLTLYPEYFASVPENCGLACSFTYRYEAPSLICHDLEAEDYSVGSHGSTADSWVLYQGDNELLTEDGSWTLDNIPFTVNYVTLSPQDGNHLPTLNATGSPVGSSCKCQDGTYEASFQYTYGAFNISTKLVSHQNSFTDNCTSLSQQEQEQSEGCYNYISKSSSTCFGFAQVFQGSISFNQTQRNFTYDGDFNTLTMEKLFKYDLDPPESGFFQPLDKFVNLSEALPALFSNLTLNILPFQDATQDVEAYIEDSGSIWDYEPLALWAVYAPALVSVFVIGLYGFYCIHANGRAMDNKFSTFLMTMRNEQLDGVYDGVVDFEGLLKRRVVYAKRGYFILDPRESRMAEATPTTPNTPLKEV